MSAVLSALRLAVSLGLFGLAPLAVLRIPHGMLWKPAVAATELGHWLALVCLVIASTCFWGRWAGPASGLVLLSAALYLSPLVRASILAPAVEKQLRQFTSVPPIAAEGAPARSAPLVYRHLLGLPGPSVVPRTHSYAEGRTLDLYLGPGRRRPLVLVLHGGSWSSGDPSQLPAINHYLAARGIAVASVGYRLAPEHPWPAPVEDVLAAVAWLVERADELGLDPDRIVLAGRSAGGHLALNTAYSQASPLIRGVIAYYPPTDMHWSWDHPGHPWIIDTHGSLSAFLGGPPTEHPDVYTAASPYHQVRAGLPPTLLIHGERDELVFSIHSERLQARLDEAGVRCLLLRLPWSTHGLDYPLSGPGGQISTYAIERFLADVFD